MSKKGLFITGTDTDVGKTYIGAQIIRQLQTKVARIKTRKPIESGCELLHDGSLYPADGAALQQANHQNDSIDMITPFRFEPAVAPDRAARLTNTTISTTQLVQACLNGIDAEDFLLVEGAGGFYSPLSSDGLNVDLATALELPIVLVVKDQLGCINHTLLTLAAIQQTALNCLFIVLNKSTEQLQQTYNHAEEIQLRSNLPVFTCLLNSELPEITGLIEQ